MTSIDSDNAHPASTKGNEPRVFERRYRASLDDLWELWTTKDGFESWWAPVGFRADVHAIDPRVGGTLRYDMCADTEEMVAAMAQMGRPPSHPAQATFVELRAHEHLVLEHIVDFLPGVATYRSRIAVDFRLEGQGACMRITLYPMHDAEFTKMSAEGMQSQLTKLDDRFASA